MLQELPYIRFSHYIVSDCSDRLKYAFASFRFTTDTFFGTMYTSDDRGILFSKSLERHLFDGQRKSDFSNITSLRGVYLTNKLDDGKVCSPCALSSNLCAPMFLVY